MDENLVGYLIGALDPETHRQVEAHLQAHPESRRRLEALHRLVAPLGADRDRGVPGLPPHLIPPPGLAERTLALCLEEVQSPATLPLSAGLPAAPRPGRGQRFGSSVAWYRRGDAIVAASIILVFLGIALPMLARVTRQHQVYACQNNLRALHAALVSYSDRHEGQFPRVEASPPRNVAGIFVPILKDAGLLNAEASLACPAHGKAKPACCSLQELETMHRERPGEFRDAVRSLSCCYAYSLGYGVTDAQGNVIHTGLRRGQDSDLLPILADQPAYSGSLVKSGNSPNHGGRGQNVLHVGGHIEFRTQRKVGVNGDDIYVNHENLAAAGRDRDDTVLGASWTRPYPVPNE